MRKGIYNEQAIIADYQNNEIKVKAIMSKYGIASSTLNRIVKENNIPLRTGTYTKKAEGVQKAKRCPNCRRKIDVKGARFCCFCGADIRDEKDLVLEKTTGLFQLLMLLPSNARDEARQTIIEIERYIKNNT